jgi:hypothetical protein
MDGAITSLLLYDLVFKGTTLLFPLKAQGLKETRQQESAPFLHIYFRNTRSFDFALLGLQFREGFCISCYYIPATTSLLSLLQLLFMNKNLGPDFTAIS